MKYLLLFIFPCMLSAAPVIRPIDLRFSQSGIFDPATRTLKIEANNERSQAILIIENPEIRARQYALMGEVRYENVSPAGYFEMWSVFPSLGKEEPQRYFSRSTGDAGPLAQLSGSCGWRPFSLPFDCGEQRQRPESLEFNIILPGKGLLEMRNLRLLEKGSASPDGWWSREQAGKVAALLGIAFGVPALSAIALLSTRRRLALAILSFVAVEAFVCLAAVAVALFYSQPLIVWVPLAAAGIIGLSMWLSIRLRISDTRI